MSDSQVDLREEIGRAAVSQEEPGDRHPGPDELIAYHGGKLGGEESEAVQEHLARCRSCTEDLLDLDAFVEAGEAPPAASADFGAGATWRGLAPDLPGPARSSSAWPPSAERREAPSRSLQAWPSLAAALLAVALGLGLWTAQQRSLIRHLQGDIDELNQVRVNVPVFQLGGDERGDPGESRVGPLAEDEPFFRFQLILDAAVESGKVELVIEDSRGAERWRGPAKVDEFGYVEVTLPRSFIGEEYRIVVFGTGDGERQRLEEFPFWLALKSDKN